MKTFRKLILIMSLSPFIALANPVATIQISTQSDAEIILKDGKASSLETRQYLGAYGKEYRLPLYAGSIRHAGLRYKNQEGENQDAFGYVELSGDELKGKFELKLTLIDCPNPTPSKQISAQLVDENGFPLIMKMGMLDSGKGKACLT